MRKFTFYLLIFFAFHLSAQGPVWSWAKATGGDKQNIVSSMAVDKFGNSYTVGYFYSSTLTFGNTTLTNTSPYNCDLFILKCNKNGDLMWVKSAGGIAGETTFSVAVDGAGYVYWTGSFSSPQIKFDNVMLNNAGPGTSDVFVAKYDNIGNVMWAKSYGGSGNDYAASIKINSPGNFIVSGNFASSSIDFGGFSLTNSGADDLFITKFDLDGNVIWAQKASGAGADFASDLGIDMLGNSYLSGRFSGKTINFGGKILNSDTTLVSTFFITKYDKNGSALWAKSASNENAQYLALDSVGNVYVTGSINGNGSKFGQTYLPNHDKWTYDQYLVKFNKNGDLIWAQGAGGDKNDIVKSISVDKSNNIYLAGTFQSSLLNFGQFPLNSSGDYEMYLVRYTQDGSVLGALKYGGSKTDEVGSLVVDNNGDMFLGGMFNSPALSFGSTSVQSVTDNNIFIASTIHADTTKIYGCKDPKAKNYNPLATMPAPCYYDSTTTNPISGCKDPKAKNYNPLATMPAQCIYDSTTTNPIYGCLDQKAKNYNPLATMPAPCYYDSTSTTPIYGCMNPQAKNYNPLANTPNGSCIFGDSTTVIWGCMNPAAKNFNPIATKENGTCQFGDSLKVIFGCMNPKALNFNKYATKEDGSCQFPQTTVPIYGCTNPVARNYNPLATFENGSCVFGDSTLIVWGCMNSTAVNYNPKAVKDNGTCIFGNQNYIFGCMNPTAKNYNRLANKEDGSCIFVDSSLIVWGCTNPMAKNFNPKANKENGTCIFVDSVQVVWGCTNNQAMNYNPKATMENGTCVFAKDASVIYGCTKPGALNYNALANKENGSCVFRDSVAQVLGCTNPMARNYNPGATKDNGTCVFQDTTKIIPGCTNPTAKNFNRLATHDNGTCVFSDEATKIYGCTKSTAKNYNPLATVENGSCVFADTIKLPVYGCTNKLAKNYNPLATVNNGTCKFDTILLVMGCTDKKAKNFNPLARVNDGSCKYDSIKTVYGCTDPIALNYNPLAKIDNKNCVYQTMIPGCMDTLALNFNPYANVKDGSCRYPVKIWGCTDKSALNYNPAATHNDGNCQFSTQILGCTDPLALNYNPLATKDNRSCVFAPAISLGCTNKQALNYNPNANTDNGTCIFETVTDTITGCMDKNALNYNPVATKLGGNCVYAGVSIAGCTSPMALNYNAKATIDDESCIFAKPVNIVLPVDKDELIAVSDTLAKVLENSCSFNFNTPIDTVYIVSSTITGINEIQVVWAIKQGAVITNVTSNYNVDKDGKALLFLSLVCNSGGSKVIVGGKYGVPYGGALVQGVTVSSYYQVPTNATRLILLNQSKQAISMYPNPVKDVLQIDYMSSRVEKITILISSLDGKRIISQEMNAVAGQNRYELKTSVLVSGIYMISIRSNSVLIHVDKLLKTN